MLFKNHPLLHPLLLLSSFLSVSVLSGCLATQQDVVDLEDQTDSLKQQIAPLSKTLADLQANQADLSVQIQDLRKELAAYTENIHQTQGDMQNLSSKLDDMSVAVSKQVASIGSSLADQEKQGLSAAAGALQNKTDALWNAALPSSIFQAAETRLSLRQYSLAAQGFSDYLDRFPKGALADAAAYKMGEAYFGLKAWDKAGSAFASLIEKHPKSSLVPAGRLMYALCLIHLKKHLAEARQYLESIPQDFPQSPEASAAKRELAKLKGRNEKKRKETKGNKKKN